MASHREWILEKTRKFQIVYLGPTTISQHSTTSPCERHNYEECKQAVLSKVRSFTMYSKTRSSFLYSVYHQRVGKTSLFDVRGVDFTHFKT